MCGASADRGSFPSGADRLESRRDEETTWPTIRQFRARNQRRHRRRRGREQRQQPDEDRPQASEAAQAAAAAKASNPKRTKHLVAGAAIGIGSAAVVAALLYARSSRKADRRDD
jgi:hypothetical protein